MRTILLILFVLTLINAPVKAQSLFGRDWKVGCYYDAHGNKVAGVVSWDPPKMNMFAGKGDQIFFKKDSTASKRKVKSDTITAFVMGVDSFTVSHYSDLESHPFLLVKVNGPTKLYYSAQARQSSMASFSGMPVSVGFNAGAKITYYYGPDPDKLTELDRASFIDVMSRIMADKPEVVAAIKAKTYKFGSLDDLLVYYKTGVKKSND